MTQEAPRQPGNQEVGQQSKVEFYAPVTKYSETLERLSSLSVVENPTNEDLFKAIADTFATIATINFENGKNVILKGHQYRAEDWRETDDLQFSTKKLPRVYIGYCQPKEGERVPEAAFIEGICDGAPHNSIFFEKSDNGSVNVYMLEGGKDEGAPYNIPVHEKKIIVGTLLEAMNSTQPVSV